MAKPMKAVSTATAMKAKRAAKPMTAVKRAETARKAMKTVKRANTKASRAMMASRSRKPVPRILKLGLTKQWFELMVLGKKREEWREVGKWMTSRLHEGGKNGTRKQFDLVEFKNGFARADGTGAPVFWAKFRGWEIVRPGPGGLFKTYRHKGEVYGVRGKRAMYKIKLGKVVGKRHCRSIGK